MVRRSSRQRAHGDSECCRNRQTNSLYTLKIKPGLSRLQQVTEITSDVPHSFLAPFTKFLSKRCSSVHNSCSATCWGAPATNLTIVNGVDVYILLYFISSTHGKPPSMRNLYITSSAHSLYRLSKIMDRLHLKRSTNTLEMRYLQFYTLLALIFMLPSVFHTCSSRKVKLA